MKMKMGSQIIEITEPRRELEREMVLVMVNVTDAKWAEKDERYVGVGGINQIGTRYARFATFLQGMIDDPEKLVEVEAPEMDIDADGVVDFFNGHHRWAYMRDNGAIKIPVMLTVEGKANALAYGYLG